MNESFLLESPALDGVSLRTATPADCEDLRSWKNEHRFRFFFQDLITPEQQRRWFDGYQARADDFMFVVRDGEQTAGCMGFRLRDGQSDVYNVILGDPRCGRRGVMARGMALMCSFARLRLDRPVVARVLKQNPAAAWYQRRGFTVLAEEEGHYLMGLADGFIPVPVVRRELDA